MGAAVPGVADRHVAAGTDRDCLNAIDLFFSPGAANLPEVLVTDTGSYSDLIFGIASLLGVDYRPRAGRPARPERMAARRRRRLR